MKVMLKSSTHFLLGCLLISFLVALFGTLMRHQVDQYYYNKEIERMKEVK